MGALGALLWLVLPGVLLVGMGWRLRPGPEAPGRAPLGLGLAVHLWAAVAVLAPVGEPSALSTAILAATPLMGLVVLRLLVAWHRVADDRWGAIELLYLGWVLGGTPWLLLRGARLLS